MLRASWRFFTMSALAGLALRLLFLFSAPRVTDDSHIYADLAKNWLQHGIYGVSANGHIVPTYMRLPGYPAFLAATFAFFGSDNFKAALLAQVVIDLGTCFVVAVIARKLISPRAAKAAFLLAALCPFTANYAAAALTETLEVFFTALALSFAISALQRLPQRHFRSWIYSGLSIAACIYLRPDGGLLLAAIEVYIVYELVRSWQRGGDPRKVLAAGALLAISALVPLAPWTIRNSRTFHVFEPLTPRYANEPGEFVPMGFNRWIKTWMAEYTSVEEVYWQEPGGPIDPAVLPSRAFDGDDQKQQTLALLEEYNQSTDIEPELDQKFASLAQERIHHHPLRYYVWLPALRIADMWLRPRTELLPPDPRWWQFNDDRKWIILSLGFGLLNLAYMALALRGGWLLRNRSHAAMLICYVVVRSLFLGTLENPEPRYTLEGYPIIFFLGASALAKRRENSPVPGAAH
jgi:4-amino-4-deoxy-L-arabinose transferase-like glycosyltransferase